MKKFLVLAVVSLLILSVFVACGGGDMKDDMTTMMDDMTSMMDNLTSEGRGEVTEDESKIGCTGMLLDTQYSHT